MSISLFTKTWRNDLEWLEMAIISVSKLCQESVEWTITTEDEDVGGVWAKINYAKSIVKNTNHIQFRVLSCYEIWPESKQISQGYMRQQWIKMNAHMGMSDGLFWNWDSDVIAIKPFSSATFIGKSGKPILWFSQFNAIMNGSDRPAHESRMAMMREVLDIPRVSFEWMRCMPIPLFGQILRHGSMQPEWGKSFEMLKNGDARFSEFNVLGEFCHLYYPDAFEYRNAEASGPTWSGGYVEGGQGSGSFQEHAFVSQCWSWGAIPEHVKKFVDGL